MRRERAIGVTLPFRKGTNGYFEQSYETFEQVKSNIVSLFSTRRGERIMQPRLGSDILNIVFEPIDTADLKDGIRSVVKSALEEWLPYVFIKDLSVRATDEMVDRNYVEITLKFGVQNQPGMYETITFNIYV